MIVYKSKFSKEFVKKIIEKFDGTQDIYCLTYELDNGRIEQEFHTATEIDKLVLDAMNQAELRPYEEWWVEKHRERVQQILLKKPEESLEGN